MTQKPDMYIVLAVHGAGSLDSRFQAHAWGEGLTVEKAKRNCKRFIDVVDWSEKKQDKLGWLYGKMPSDSHSIDLENLSYNMGSTLTWEREPGVKDPDKDIEWLNLAHVRSLYQGEPEPPYTGSIVEGRKQPRLVLVK